MRALVFAVPLLTTASITCGACGARSGLALPEEEAQDDATIDVADTAIVLRDVGVDVRDAIDTTVPCVADTDGLVAKIVPGVGSCTTVLSLSRATGTITGYRMMCASYGGIDEATAVKKAQTDTGVGFVGCLPTKSISGTKPADDFVFFQPASAAACACCGDGWFTAVSARNGLTLLGGEISLGEGRGLVYPTTFDDPKELGTACGPTTTLPPVRGWDLTKMGTPGATPPALDAPIMESLLRTVYSTALPEAIARQQYLFDAVVLLYTPHASAPLDAEWLVLLNSGWLE